MHQVKPLTVGYARVSSQEQATHGVSLEAQQDRLRAFAAARGCRVDEMIIDSGESAKTLKRAGMMKIIDGTMTRRIGTVLVVKLDRLTRSVRDLADLLDIFEKNSVALVSLTESLDTATAAGRLMLNLLACIGQWEREAIGERTASALAHKRRGRKVYGHAAFGWRREGDDLIPEPDEQAALRVVAHMRADKWSLSRIGAWLTAEGFIPRQGGSAWRRSAVAQLLRSRIAKELVLADTSPRDDLFAVP